LKKAVLIYIEISEKIGLQEKIALVTFGSNTGVKCNFSTNYTNLKRIVQGLKAGGSTPMGDGLAYCLKEITDNGAIFRIGNTTILPRIILLTDGEPDNKDETITIAQNLGRLRFPITAMGVEGCNGQVMRNIAKQSNGVFIMIHEIDKLVEQFLQQIFLLLFIIEMQDQLENMYNKLVIKAYLEDRMNRAVSNDEVELFILFLQAIVVSEQSNDNSPRTLPSSNNNNRSNNNNNTSISMVVINGVTRRSMEVDLYWTIEQLMRQIERQVTNDAKVQSIQIGGVICNKSALVNSYNPDDGDSIQVTLKVKGGLV